MMRGTLSGMERILETDIPKGTVILIKGDAGTMKTAFTFNVMHEYLKDRPDEFGVYMSLEQTRESHLMNMHSIGMPDIPNLIISDFWECRREFGKGLERDNILDLVINLLTFFSSQKKGRFTVFALDSLNIMYDLSSGKIDRDRMYQTLERLRELNLYSFLILESPSNHSAHSSFCQSMPYGSESFMTDGIIEMGTVDTKDDVIRYIQIRKMRSVKHSMKRFQFRVENGRLQIMRPVYD